MKISEKIKLVRKSQTPKLTQAEFGARIGVSRNSINNFENDRSEPSEANLRMLCHVYCVNYDWLMGDESADMFVTPNNDDRRIQDILSGNNAFAKRVLRVLSRLSDEEWATLERIVNAMSQRDE